MNTPKPPGTPPDALVATLGVYHDANAALDAVEELTLFRVRETAPGAEWYRVGRHLTRGGVAAVAFADGESCLLVHLVASRDWDGLVWSSVVEGYKFRDRERVAPPRSYLGMTVPEALRALAEAEPHLAPWVEKALTPTEAP